MENGITSTLLFPHLIDWAITGRCNLHCQHCRGMPKGELTTSRALNLVDEIAELKPGWVIIEGGEPILREDLFAILGKLVFNQIPVHLITNGMLLNNALLSALDHLTVKLMISIDGASPETYESIRNGANFLTVINSTQECARRGLLEAINFTVCKSNYTEIPKLFALAAGLGANKINLIGLKPCHHYKAELLSPVEYLEAIKLTCQSAHETGLNFFFDEPFFHAVAHEYQLLHRTADGVAGILAPSTTACIFGEYIFIEPDGGVKPCSFSPMSLDNINNKPLVEIWQNISTAAFINRIKSAANRNGDCSNCAYLNTCKGCRSRTYALTGDWFGSDTCCPLTLKLEET